MGLFGAFAKGSLASMAINKALGRRSRRRFGAAPMPMGFGRSAIVGGAAMWAFNKYVLNRNKGVNAGGRSSVGQNIHP